MLLYGSFDRGIKILKLADNQAEQRQIGQCTRKKIEAVLILINNTIKTPIIKLKMASLSLNEQMTILQKQQTTLAEKIKQEEERKRKQQLTLQTLQNLNEQQNKAIKTYKSLNKKMQRQCLISTLKDASGGNSLKIYLKRILHLARLRII